MKIWNRTNCCWERLYGAEIQLLVDGQWVVVGTYIENPNDPSGPQEFEFDTVTDVTQIRVILNGCGPNKEGDSAHVLSLAEVEAWGYVM